jgi:aminocarboxymuconate-semialdehyde decarboxylase
MKLDIFNHIFPKGFYDKMLAVAPNQKDMGKRVRNVPVIVDLDLRFKVMDISDHLFAQSAFGGFGRP